MLEKSTFKLSDEIKEKIKKTVREKELSDGTPFEHIVLGVHTREEVLSINDEAKEIGVYKVVYIDDLLDLWDINPPGCWKN